MTHQIEKFALLILILYALSIGISLTSNILFDFLVPSYPAKEIVTIQLKALALIFYAFKIVINIGSCIWLYFQAKANQDNKWLWLLIGLFTGIIGIIAWILKEILKEIRSYNREEI